MRKLILIFGLFIIYPQFVFADELIINGNFFSTNPGVNIPGWLTGSAYASQYVPSVHTNLYEPPWPNGNSGNVCVMAGNSGSANSVCALSYLYQNVYIPRYAIGTTITLHYQRFVAEPNLGQDQYVFGRFGSIQLFYEQSGISSALPTPIPGWAAVIQPLPLENYDGTAVQLYFEVHEDGINDVQYIHLDRITLDVITATKTNTPTITHTKNNNFHLYHNSHLYLYPDHNPHLHHYPHHYSDPDSDPLASAPGRCDCLSQPGQWGYCDFYVFPWMRRLILT